MAMNYPKEEFQKRPTLIILLYLKCAIFHFFFGTNDLRSMFYYPLKKCNM